MTAVGRKNYKCDTHFLLHREWNEGCNDFHDCPLVEWYDLRSFWYVSSYVQGLSRIEVLWSSCFWGLFTNPKLPGGAPNIRESWSLALREMKTGGTLLPTELMIIHTVIIVPRSPEAACPTCFVPFWAIILEDCTTVNSLLLFPQCYTLCQQ